MIAVVVDTGSNRLAGVPVTFTVQQGAGSFGGQPSITVNQPVPGVTIRAVLTNARNASTSSVQAAATD